MSRRPLRQNNCKKMTMLAPLAFKTVKKKKHLVSKSMNLVFFFVEKPFFTKRNVTDANIAISYLDEY